MFMNKKTLNIDIFHFVGHFKKTFLALYDSY